MNKASDSKFKGLFLGFTSTAIIQSSSAVLAILVSLIDAGIVQFNQSLPILLGSNLGTTVTAWLVSFKISGLGYTLLAIGFVLSYFKGRWNIIAKPIFYLGLILFSLDLLSQNLSPIKESDYLVNLLEYASLPILGVLAGALITAVCQSSSVTIGLAIILCDQGVMSLESSIPVVVGSNLGSTVTAFLASISLNEVARRTAWANLLFNSIGLLVYLPSASLFEALINSFDLELSFQVALAHLLFNLIMTLAIFPFIKPLGRIVEKYI